MKTNNRKAVNERSEWEDNWDRLESDITSLKKVRKAKKHKHKAKNQKHHHLDEDHLMDIDLDNWGSD